MYQRPVIPGFLSTNQISWTSKSATNKKQTQTKLELSHAKIQFLSFVSKHARNDFLPCVHQITPSEYCQNPSTNHNESSTTHTHKTKQISNCHPSIVFIQTFIEGLLTFCTAQVCRWITICDAYQASLSTGLPCVLSSVWSLTAIYLYQ